MGDASLHSHCISLRLRGVHFRLVLSFLSRVYLSAFDMFICNLRFNSSSFAELEGCGGESDVGLKRGTDGKFRVSLTTDIRRTSRHCIGSYGGS